MQYSINKLSMNVREFIHTVQKKSNPLEEDEDNGLTDIQVQQLKALRKLSGHLDEIKFKDVY